MSTPIDLEGPSAADKRVGVRVASLSLVVGILLFGLKLLAWIRTGSTAVLSDALESIVNVVAAAFALYSVQLAGKPADRDHPYGHGKVEFLSAAFEGGLIFLAGGLICYEAVTRLWVGVRLEHLREGIVLVVVAAVTNLIVALLLIRTGRRTHSLTLVADGKHLLTDVVTSVGVVLGLVLVIITGQTWLDPVVALLAAANILRVGWRLFREAVGGIMDEADIHDLGVVQGVLDRLEDPLLVGWSRLRMRHQGALHHVDLTLQVPGETPVREANELVSRVEQAIRDGLGHAEVLCHVEALGELTVSSE